jgi:heat shock protein HslJ
MPAEPPPVTQPEQSPEPTAGPTPVVVSVSDIADVQWQWAETVETVTDLQTVVSDPQNYTLTFFPDGSISVKADCNRLGGTYSLEGNALAFTLGPTTMAHCGDESLDQQYLTMLSNVEAASFDSERLVLHLKEDAGHMTLNNGGPGDAKVPEEEKIPTAAGPVPAATGAGIDVASISLDTMGLPYSWQANVVPATPYDASQPPGAVGLPEHIQINFGSSPGDRQPGDPVIYIVPLEPYEELWNANDDPFITILLEEIVTLLVERPEPIPGGGIPVLPIEEVGAGINDLAVQGKYLDLNAGTGMRFVGRFAQDPNPVTNQGLRYVYQGISSDGRYLVAFFYPVSTSALPQPEVVSAEEQQRLDSDIGAYMGERAQVLNGLAESDWTPELSLLDSVMASLTFNTAAPSAEIVNMLWKWEAFNDTGETPIPVENPDSYTLVLFPDGSLSIKADCNLVGGLYRVEGVNLTIELGPSTMASCGEQSLDQQFLANLGRVESFALADGRLFLELRGEAGSMVFANGGPVAAAPPPPTRPPTEVRSTSEGLSIDPASVTLNTEGIPYAWQVNLVPATPYDDSQPPGPRGLTEHIQINFGAADPKDKQPGDPVIYIIPVKAYKQLWEGAGDQGVSITVDMQLEMLQDRSPAFPTNGVPVLPFEEIAGYNDLAVQGHYLDFGRFSGMRFVGRHVQDPNPIANEGLRYIFQGYAGDDSEYLIAFFYPVITNALPVREAVSAEEEARAVGDIEGYLMERAEMLNGLSASDWELDLSLLDLVLSSLTFTIED